MNHGCPLVTWLLATERSGDFLYRAIDSCLNQTFNQFEMIVVCNGTNAEEIAQSLRNRYSDVSCLRIFTTYISNLSFSLSLGLHYAKAPLIARMDSDDISKPERLALQLKYMEKHPDITVLGTGYEFIDENDQSVGIVIPRYITNADIRRCLYYSNPICHPSVMFRKEFVLSSGGYLGGKHAQDYDLWTRLALLENVKFANMPDICLGYRKNLVGDARGSQFAYAVMAGSQLRNFILTWNPKWILGMLLNLSKRIFRNFESNFSLISEHKNRQ